MSNTTREKLADLVLEGIDAVHDMDVTHDEYAWSAADAIFAALPDLVRGMIKPLVWEDFKNGPYEIWISYNGIPKLRFYANIDEDGKPEVLKVGERTFISIDGLKNTANNHHVAQIMAAMNLEYRKPSAEQEGG